MSEVVCYATLIMVDRKTGDSHSVMVAHNHGAVTDDNVALWMAERL